MMRKDILSSKDYIMDSSMRIFSLVMSTVGWYTLAIMVTKEDVYSSVIIALISSILSTIILFVTIPNVLLEDNKKYNKALIAGELFIMIGWVLTGMGVADNIIKLNDKEYQIAIKTKYVYKDNSKYIKLRDDKIAEMRSPIIAQISKLDNTLNDMIYYRENDKQYYYRKYINIVQRLTTLPTIKKDTNIRKALTPIAEAYNNYQYSKLNKQLANIKVKEYDNLIWENSKEYINSLNIKNDKIIDNIRLQYQTTYIIITIIILVLAYGIEFYIINIILLIAVSKNRENIKLQQYTESKLIEVVEIFKNKNLDKFLLENDIKMTAENATIVTLIKTIIMYNADREIMNPNFFSLSKVNKWIPKNKDTNRKYHISRYLKTTRILFADRDIRYSTLSYNKIFPLFK